MEWALHYVVYFQCIVNQAAILHGFGTVVDGGLDTFLCEKRALLAAKAPFLNHLFRQRERAFDFEAPRHGRRSRVWLAAAH